MNEKDNFDIKYWGNNYFYVYPNDKQPKRSIKKRFLIVICFIGILALLPLTITFITKISFDKAKQVTLLSIPPTTEKEKTTVNQNIDKTPISKTTTAEVFNNDSYWKISKRLCGTGKFYLSVKDQNNNKPLHKGDFVSVNCTL